MISLHLVLSDCHVEWFGKGAWMKAQVSSSLSSLVRSYCNALGNYLVCLPVIFFFIYLAQCVVGCELIVAVPASLCKVEGPEYNQILRDELRCFWSLPGCICVVYI